MFFVLIGIGRLLGTDYLPTNNRPVPYWCISTNLSPIVHHFEVTADYWSNFP